MATQFRKELTDFLRPRLGGSLSQEVVDWLDGRSDRAGVPRDGTAATLAANKPKPPAPPPAPPPVPKPAPKPAPADDRFDALFKAMAGAGADPNVVSAVARSFATHATAYGQDKSKARIAEFVAQIANETGGFTTFSENLNYSTEALLKKFGRHRISAADAELYGRNAQHPANKEMIANLIYGGPWGKENLGNTDAGDGWKYRGRGSLQLTGRTHYGNYGGWLTLPLLEQPDLATDPADSTLIALEFFKRNKVNDAVDKGDFGEARRITNGGSIGLEEVARLREKALALL